ncbi:hypothetical protein TNCV_2122871 [Trichonephila clavipes]|nr:hypothetical protein TNCV_2122871 [Trichonephila clavipes]
MTVSQFLSCSITEGDHPGASHLFSPSTNLTGGLEARQIFRVPPYLERTSIHKYPCLLRDSNPKPYGTVFSITNHYTRQMAQYA